MKKKEIIYNRYYLTLLQKKPCCKYWIKMWVDIIYKALKNTEGGEFKHCPECGIKFRKIK